MIDWNKYMREMRDEENLNDNDDDDDIVPETNGTMNKLQFYDTKRYDL